jgi:hypothetical protein
MASARPLHGVGVAALEDRQEALDRSGEWGERIQEEGALEQGSAVVVAIGVDVHVPEQE